MARERAGYRTWFNPVDDIPVGIPEFLELCQEVGAEPWIVTPTAMSLDETRRLAEYLAGSAATAGRRTARGGRKARAMDGGLPHHSHRAGQRSLERAFRGESIEDPAAYGRRANAVFAAFRAAAGPAAGKFDLVVGTHAYDPDATPRCSEPRRWPIRWPSRRI